MPFVSIPYFVNAAQFDSFQMLYDLGGNPPVGARQVLFADAFQNATIAALQPAVAAGQGVFSTSCIAHCLTDDSTMYHTFLANGVSIATALSSWYWGGVTAQAVSDCVGYPCAGGAACPGGSATPGMATDTALQEEIDANGGRMPKPNATAAPASAAGGARLGSGGSSWMQMGRRLLRGGGGAA